MKNNRETGTVFEGIAASFLEKQGYQLIEKNFRCRFGEIDLIAKEDDYLVFIEVKYRSNLQTGLPEEAVSLKKQKVISKVADYYIVKRQIGLELPIRFDVVSILGNEVKVYRNAFDYCGKS